MGKIQSIRCSFPPKYANPVTLEFTDLRGTVVAGDDVGRHHEGGAGGARQTEVQDLERAVCLHHYVARLQILGKGLGLLWSDSCCSGAKRRRHKILC